MSLGTIKDYTPNFNFIIPEFNISGWHDYLEEDLRSIDALLYNIFDIQNYVGRWQRLTTYETGQVVFIDDATDPSFMGKMYKVLENHTTTDTTFDDFYTLNPTYYERFLDASSAQQYANYCKIYAEGTDEEAATLDITHSCKKWNELCEDLKDLAKDWATKTSDTVDGNEYSAKYYAIQAHNTYNDILAKKYAKDLDYTNNVLQLVDENGNLIGTPQTIDALPSQTGQSGKFLTTDGTNSSWGSINLPTVNDATVTLMQGSVIKGSFSVNQSTNSIINLDAGGGGGGTDYVKIENNITVQETDFIEDDTYEEYPYKVELNILSVRSNITCMVSLPLNIANSGIFAPIAETSSGKITLYAKDIIEDTFIIPSITIFDPGVR